MIWKHVCWECGETFTREGENRAFAIRYCPKCKKIKEKENLKNWRKKQRLLATKGIDLKK